MLHSLKVATVWQSRERIELEAAREFSCLAESMSLLRWPEQFVAKARESSADELRHADLCRDIIESLEPGLERLPPRPYRVGQEALSDEDNLVYAAAALSCVTETLSTALLLAMRARAKYPQVAGAVREILKDEIGHSRIGWAVLARASANRDVSWLGARVPAMLKGALEYAAPLETKDEIDMSAYGILSPRESLAICAETVSNTIYPGFERFGVYVDLMLLP